MPSSVPDYDQCPYCGTRHPEGIRERDYYRCHGCNFFISASWLIDDFDAYLLDRNKLILCPWCGFPAGEEQVITEDEGRACGGCGGTLTSDYLVTQADLRQDRDVGTKTRNQYLVILAVMLMLFVILAFVAF